MRRGRDAKLNRQKVAYKNLIARLVTYTKKVQSSALEKEVISLYEEKIEQQQQEKSALEAAGANT